MRWNAGRSLLLAAFVSIIAPSLQGEELAPLPTPSFERKSLLNGMEFLFFDGPVERPPFVLLIKNGAAFDPVGKWGATYLTTEMLIQETANRTRQSIDEELKQIGADLQFQVRWDGIFIYGHAPNRYLEEVLSLLADMIVHPAFREEAFQEMRSRLVQRIKEEQNLIEERTQDIWLARVFRGNPYQHPVEGTLATLQAMRLTDLKIQYRRLFLPNQTHLALFFSGDRQALFKKLSRRWGSWVRDDPLPFTFRKARPARGRQVFLIDAPPAASLFRWGGLGVSLGSRDSYALEIFRHYLTLTLPEWAKEVTAAPQIRASCQVESRRMPGYLQLSIRARPERLLAYYQRFQDLVGKVGRGEVNRERFEEARKLAYLEMARRLEKPLSTLFTLLETNLYGAGINYLSHYGVRLARVGENDFSRAVRKYADLEHFTMVVAAPPSQVRSQLESLGSLVILQ